MSSIKKEANANQPPVSLKANNRAVRQQSDRHLNTSSRRRHCERSEAIHLATVRKNGLLRCARNDVEFQTRVRNLFVEEPLDEIAPAIEVRAKANWFLSIALAWNIGPRAHRGQAQALSLFFGP